MKFSIIMLWLWTGLGPRSVHSYQHGRSNLDPSFVERDEVSVPCGRICSGDTCTSGTMLSNIDKCSRANPRRQVLRPQGWNLILVDDEGNETWADPKTKKTVRVVGKKDLQRLRSSGDLSPFLASGKPNASRVPSKPIVKPVSLSAPSDASKPNLFHTQATIASSPPTSSDLVTSPSELPSCRSSLDHINNITQQVNGSLETTCIGISFETANCTALQAEIKKYLASLKNLPGASLSEFKIPTEQGSNVQPSTLCSIEFNEPVAFRVVEQISNLAKQKKIKNANFSCSSPEMDENTLTEAMADSSPEDRQFARLNLDLLSRSIFPRFKVPYTLDCDLEAQKLGWKVGDLFPPANPNLPTECRDPQWNLKMNGVVDNSGKNYTSEAFAGIRTNEINDQIRINETEAGKAAEIVSSLNAQIRSYEKKKLSVPPNLRRQLADARSNLGKLALARDSLVRKRDDTLANGEGVKIAFPDTGIVAAHPELKGNVLCAEGKNLMEVGESPCPKQISLKEGSAGFNMRGHATTAAGLIVSPAGKQHGAETADEIRGAPAQYDTELRGVASSSQIVPYRISNNIPHIFSYDKLTRSIYAAIEHNREVDRREQELRKTNPNASLEHERERVLLMTRGGLYHSPTLERAMREARKSGMIVVAAAGNNVQWMVYPARDKNAIGVAAVNSQAARWSGSSYGKSARVSAPGQYTGDIKLVDGEGQKAAISHGSGTTMASSSVAGIVANWLAYRGTEISENYPPELRQELFSYMLDKHASTVTRPVNDKDANYMGAGILNMRGLMEAPLPSMAELENYAIHRPNQDPEFADYLQAKSEARRENRPLNVLSRVSTLHRSPASAGKGSSADTQEQINEILRPRFAPRMDHAPANTSLLQTVGRTTSTDTEYSSAEAAASLLFSPAISSPKEQLKRYLKLMQGHGQEWMAQLSGDPLLRARLAGDISGSDVPGCSDAALDAYLRERVRGSVSGAFAQAL